MRLAHAALFALLLVACNHEKRARKELADDGYIDVVLAKSGSGYTFTAKNAAGQHCSGSVDSYGGKTEHTSMCVDVCTMGEPTACFTMAQHEEATDPNQALRDYTTGCNSGDMPCCVSAGLMYDKGKGIPKDADKSFAFDKKACDGKDAQGCLNVAIDYDLGLGTPKDLLAAYRAADFACKGKVMTGCKLSGQYLVLGQGVPRDVITGADLLERACSSGEAFGACTSLGYYYVDGKKGLARDVAHGKKLLENACEHDEVTACFDLGHYIGNKTIAASDGTMIDYLKKACDKGEGAGCNELGVMMERGESGLAKDFGAALAQYEKACAGDDEMGCRNEGLMYELGRGTTKDLVKAGSLYDKCCAAGTDECCAFRKALPKK